MVGSAMTGGDIKEGIIFGAAAGLVSGGFQGYCSAKNQGLNPWTGAKLPETTVNTPNVPFEAQAEMTVAEKATTGGENLKSSTSISMTDLIDEQIPRPKITGYKPFLAGKTDLYHRFPTIFDEFIVQEGEFSLTSNGRFWYSLPGTISETVNNEFVNVPGFYTIGIYPNGEVYHRCFYKQLPKVY